MPNTVTVLLKRLPGHEDLPLPAYQTDLAAAMDLAAANRDPIDLPPGGRVIVPTGIAIAIPPGYFAEIRPRSGIASRQGITLPNAPATIDADYRGEIGIPLINLGSENFRVVRGMRIAQVLVLPFPRVVWSLVDELPETSRGSGGFGHTGV